MKWKLPMVAALVIVVVLAVGSALAGLVIHGPVLAGIGTAIGGLGGVTAG